MATKEEYLAQGKTEQQIQDAIVAKNTADMSAKLGQNIEATNYNVVPDVQTAPVSPVIQAQVTPLQANIGGKPPETQSNVPPQPIQTAQAPIVSPAQSEQDINKQYGGIIQDNGINSIQPATQVEKTTTTTPEGETVVKKETPQAVTPDYNTGKGREQDIINNLNEGKTNDVNIQRALQTGDYSTYKQAYGYDTADQTKKQMLDAFFQANQPKNSDAFLQILATGQKIQNAQYRGSPEAADAQHRYDVLSPYIGAGATSLYDAMVSGKLLPGSDAYKDMLKISGGIETPAMTEAKIKFDRKQQIDKVNNNLANLSGNKPETTSGLQKISDNLVQTKGMDYATEFQKDVVNNPAITEKVTELNSVTEQIKNLEYTKSKSLKEIMKRYPGISVGSALLQSNQENEGINDELNQLYNKQGSLKANVDYATNLAEKMFGYKIAQNQERVKAEQDIASEDRQFGRQKEIALFQQKLSNESKRIDNEYQNSRDVMNFKQDLYKMGISDEMQTGRDKMNFEQQKQLASIQNKYQSSRDVQNYNQEINKLKYTYENSPENIAKNIENTKNQNTGYLSILGNGKVTGYGGAYDGFKGLDIDGKKGDPVYGFGGKVVSIIDANFASSPYGNSVVVEDAQGNQIRLSHLDSINVKPGQEISETDVIGALGNTGNVVPGKGGDGSHLDIRVKQSGAQSEMSSKNVEQFLKGYGKKAQETGYKPSQIDSFNSLTATDKKKMMNDPSYTNFLDQKNAVMTDENASIYDVMKFSQGGKDMGEERLKSLGKFSQGLSQIGDLSKAINTQTTGPILGTLRSYNPYDSNAQALVAQINSIVPNIARGVYGEVGVLTDADIQNYAKTLPNIKSTADTNKLVLAMTLSTMLNGFKGQIQIDGSAGRDVSGFNGTVKQYETRINNLLKEIGGNTTNSSTPSGTPTYQQFY